VLKQCLSGAIKDVMIENVVETMLQKTMLQKVPYAFVASKCTSTFFFFISFKSLSPYKEDNYECYIEFIFCYSYETKAKDDDECNVHCHLLVFL